MYGFKSGQNLRETIVKVLLKLLQQIGTSIFNHY